MLVMEWKKRFHTYYRSRDCFFFAFFFLSGIAYLYRAWSVGVLDYLFWALMR